ncbi:MAG: hypothetical protein ABJB03_11770 [Rhodoglobus sp.]
MSARIPLPPEFARVPFTVAAGLRAGITEDRMRGPDLNRPFHGVRAANCDESLLALCAAYAPLLRPDQFFSHVTAARLWRLPLPRRFDPTESLHVSTLAPHRAPRSTGIVGHQAAAATAIDVRHGLPVSGPVATWLALCSVLGFDDLVAVGDALILDPVVAEVGRPHATLDELAAATAQFSGRGARVAASAVPRLRLGAESRPETILRLLLERAGLPEPMVNIDVCDSMGRFLGRADLSYPQWHTIVEYDGDEHRTDDAQYEKDMTRIEDFVLAGQRVVRVRKRGLFVAPDATVARVRGALSAAGWSPHPR